MMNNKLTESGYSPLVKFRYDLESLIQATTQLCGKLHLSFDLDELIEKIILLSHQMLGYDLVTLHLLDSDLQSFVVKIQANHLPECIDLIQKCDCI